MPHVVLLRGVNVGGHKAFSPKALADDLGHLGAVNIGAAGTFVIREKVAVAALRDAFAARLPFETEIMICTGRDVLTLLEGDWFADHPASKEFTRFASLFSRSPSTGPRLPHALPERGTWELRLLGTHQRFVVGIYRRNMKAVSHLGVIDKLFGAPATTRSWNTVERIGNVLTRG